MVRNLDSCQMHNVLPFAPIFLCHNRTIDIHGVIWQIAASSAAVSVVMITWSSLQMVTLGSSRGDGGGGTVRNQNHYDLKSGGQIDSHWMAKISLGCQTLHCSNCTALHSYPAVPLPKPPMALSHHALSGRSIPYSFSVSSHSTDSLYTPRHTCSAKRGNTASEGVPWGRQPQF